MGNCVNSLSIGQKQVYDNLVKEIGEDKAFAIYSKYNGFNPERINSNVVSEYKNDIKLLSDFLKLNEKRLSLKKSKEFLSEKEFLAYKTNKFYKKPDLNLGETTSLLKDIGVNSNNIIIEFNNLEHILSPKHNIKIDDLSNLIEAINDPIYISEDRFHKGRIEILTDLKNNEGKNIVAILEFEDKAHGLSLKSMNLVTTFTVDIKGGIENRHNNSRGINRVLQHFNSEKIVYVDKDKIATLLNTTSTEINSIGRPRSNDDVYTANIKRLYKKIKSFDNKNNISFFAKTSSGNKSELYNDLHNKNLNVNDYFEVAFSDKFTKDNDWIEAQKRLYAGEDFVDITNDMSLNPDMFYKNTFEPKKELIESYKEVLDLAKIKFSKNLNLTKKDTSIDDINVIMLSKYISIFKQKFGMDIQIVSKDALPDNVKGAKGFYSTPAGKVYYRYAFS